MAYAIMRTTKLKSIGAIGGAEIHNDRDRETLNANQQNTKFNQSIIDCGDVVEKFKEKVGNQKIRSNAVYCVDVIMTTSPEYFESNNSFREYERYMTKYNNSNEGKEEQAKIEEYNRLKREKEELEKQKEYERNQEYYNQVLENFRQLEIYLKKLKQEKLIELQKQEWYKWIQASTDWAKKRWGDNIISVKIHLDESTPHLHALVVPLDEKGKLNCRKIMGEGNKTFMNKLQTEYHKSVKHLGLERGKEKSKARHNDIKTYYQNVNKVMNKSNKIAKEIPEMTIVDRADSKRYKEKVRQQVVVPMVDEIEKLKKEVSKLKDEKRQLINDNNKNTMLRDNYKSKYEKLRDIDLNEIMRKLNYVGVSEGKDIKYKVDEKIINIRDGVFSVNFQEGKGGGGAIDLVMELQGYNFNQAVKWLDDNFGNEAVEGAIRNNYIRKADQKIKKENLLNQDFSVIKPKESVDDIEAVRDYLTNKRKLDSELVNDLIQKKQIYATRFKGFVNCVFTYTDGGKEVGCAVRGIGKSNFKQRLGKGGKFTFGDFKKADSVGIFESPIEAMSYYSLMKLKNMDTEKVCYVSFGGLSTPKKTLKFIIDNNKEIFGGFNNDVAGNEANKKLGEIVKQFGGKYNKDDRESPASGTKDFNETLIKSFKAKEFNFPFITKDEDGQAHTLDFGGR